eukprot:CAMPEP_0196143652 /NCGR_PEP_ID=MMETSP0910-20130528/13644_1 /TAXON_ID=49265 /ORGANISM="Thalassiosira rotula, Strain GSO102" /LENGTH=716 /DNA_ID=CAMNT_0041405137 /DNA_START=82 /DNA_END=2232 /DNA_ORIENTATION=+
MKLLAAALSLITASSAVAKDDDAFRPVRIRYEDVISSSTDTNTLASMMDALSDVGMVSITGFPSSFQEDRNRFQTSLGACMGRSEAARVHTFDDGTKRTTLASHTVPGPGGIQKIAHGDSYAATAEEPCASFDEAAKPFRARVDLVTRAFAARVADAITEQSPGGSLLATEDGYTFDTFHDVIDNGEHLEHFHEYERESTDVPLKAGDAQEETVEWHTDQGLLLAFTPGARVGKDGKVDQGSDDGFLIRLADGTAKVVQFDANDELVIMLGDGVDQIVNPTLKETVKEGGHQRRLRAVPHELTVAASDTSSRVWYGRMVLPPAQAVHPSHGKTFGHLRNLLIENMEDEDSEVHALGCSGTSHARQLEEAQCEPGSEYCWHRCMYHADHGVSVESCAAEGLDVRCINPRYQLYDNSHGDWFPACIDAANAPNATDLDPLPNYPRAETCTDEAHEAWVAENSKEYDHANSLPHGGHFYWSIEDDNQVRGMISFNGLFGHLSYGWAGVGPRNEMQQSHVVMAKVSAEYSARYGFNFDVDPAVHLHWIGDDLSLRHWQEPLEDWGASGKGEHEIVEEDCFTALKFKTVGIHDRPFNITGTDRLIWAANGEDMFAGYHGLSRAVFTVNWMTGEQEVKCSIAHGINSCTGLRNEVQEEEAELETGLPPVTVTDAPNDEELGATKDESQPMDEAEMVKDDSASPALSFIAPVVAVLICIISLA